MSRSFDGNSANFLSSAAELLTDFPCTLFCWVNKPDTNIGGLLGYDIDGGNGISIRVTGSNLLGGRTDVEFQRNTNTSGSPSNDTWYPLVLTVEDTTPLSSFYALGETPTSGSNPGTWPASSTPTLFIGRDGFSTDTIDALIGHPAVWNYELSGASVTELLGGTAPDNITAGTTGLLEYWALTTASLVSTGSNAGTLSITGTVPTDADNPPVSGAGVTPVITDITDTVESGQPVVITGTDFIATQGTGNVTQEAISLTETAWSDTEVTATSLDVEANDLRYGNQDFILTNNDGNSDSVVTNVTPPFGSNSIVLATLATSGDRITAIADLAATNQLVYENALRQGEVTTEYIVTVFDDGTFQVTNGPVVDGTYEFNVRAEDGTGWGTAADQTLTFVGGVIANPTIVKNIAKSIVKNIRRAI